MKPNLEKEWIVKRLDLAMFGCNEESVTSRDFLLNFLKEVFEKVNMVTCVDPQINNTVFGNSGAVGLMTSHIAVRTFPQGGSAYVVVSSCGVYDVDKVTENFCAAFDSQSYERFSLKYKVPNGPNQVLLHDSYGRPKKLKTELYGIGVPEGRVGLKKNISKVTIPTKEFTEIDIQSTKDTKMKLKFKKLYPTPKSSGFHIFNPDALTGLILWDSPTSEWWQFQHTWPEHNYVLLDLWYLNSTEMRYESYNVITPPGLARNRIVPIGHHALVPCFYFGS